MKFLHILFILLSTTVYATSYAQEILPYVKFLEHQKSAKEYILSLFEQYDIVVLCERDHAEITQYEFIQNLISDPRFIRNGGNIFIESCAENYKARIDSLLFSEGLSDSLVREKALAINRDMSFWPFWNVSNIVPFFTHIYNTNQSLDRDSKLEVYPIDRTFNWNEIKKTSQIDKFDQTEGLRDSIMAANTAKYLPGIFARGEKVLIIENNEHAFRHHPGVYLDHLMKMTTHPVANVFIHCLAATDSWRKEKYALINGGKWDAAFSAADRDFGFDFAGSPFGSDHFDLVFDIPSKYSYGDIFTGMIYYKPITEFVWSWGVPGVLSGGFDKELVRRHKIFGNKITLKKIKKSLSRVDIETYKNYYPRYKKAIQQYLKKQGSSFSPTGNEENRCLPSPELIK